MTNITVLVVHFIPVKTNFIYLHSKFLSKFNSNSLDSVTCVEIKHKNNLYYGSCYSESYNSNGENALNISCAYGNSLGIEEHETIILSVARQLPSLKTIHVTPVSSDDWGILENSAEIVQSTLLNQIRVVCVHQNLVVWVSKTFSLTIHIDRLDVGNEYGKLEQFTELIVSPNIKDCELCSSTNRTTTSAISSQNSVSNIRNIPFLKYVFSLINPSETPPTQVSQGFSKPAKYSYIGIFRCLPVNLLKSFASIPNFHNYHYPYHVYVSSKYFLSSSSKVDDQMPILCRLTHLPFISSKPSEIEKSAEKLDHRTPSIANGTGSREIYVYLFTILEDHFSSNAETNSMVEYPTVFVSETIKRTLGSRINSKIMLETVERPVSTLTLTEINFSFLNSQKVIDQSFSAEVKQHLCSHNEQKFFLLNNYCLFESIGDEYLYFSFNPADVSFVEMSYDDLQQCNFIFLERKITHELNDYSEPKMSHQLLHLSCFQKIVDELKSSIFLELHDQRWRNEVKLLVKNSNHIVIEGDNGSGKSSVINLLTDQLRFGLPFCGIFVKKLDCKTLKGKMVQKLEKVFEKALDECVHFQPSVLIFDDLDVLFISSKQTNHSEERSLASYTNRLSTMLCDLISFYLPNRVTVLATATNVSSFEANLFQARGATVFSKKIRIPPLDRDLRRDALIELLKNKYNVIIPESMVKSYNFQDVIQQLEAFCIQDVDDLANRIYFEMLKRRRVQTQVQPVDSVIICQEDIDRAFSQIIPMSLKGVDFLKNSSISWKNVGGLESAKQVLTEILIWPSKHSKVFKQCPLKMQSAVLLYGAPGCGKTLLASAIAGESGLNFISIKGPELLSKFVGESEEGVRRTFRRAQNAKPCILFFDEFESLAPRRGNDITGVTDRVVNQLLTELDGVESISGVWILAATSKPDLIDPALLRPGRLGSLVYCPLPNQSDRLSILNVICESTHLADDVNLNTIAEITEGYTGADLRAVLFNAYMNCDKTGTVSRSSDENEYSIDMTCLVMAVKNTKPSLKLEERMQFEKLYRGFSQKDEKFNVGLEKQRLSYA